MRARGWPPPPPLPPQSSLLLSSFSPFSPMSWIVTPAHGLPSGWRMRTSRPCTPSSRPPTSRRAKTTAQAACTAPLVIQYLAASPLGVWTSQVWVAASYVAVVPISTALLPHPSSVRAKQPVTSRASTCGASGPQCRSVPSFSTVPANRLKWTVALVAMAPSAKPHTSCTAKMLRGLVRKSILCAERERERERDASGRRWV